MPKAKRKGNIVTYSGYEYTFETEAQAIQFENCLNGGGELDACLDQIPDNCYTRRKPPRPPEP